MKATQRQTVEAVRRLNAELAMCRTGEVAGALGVSYTAASRRLNRLARAGVLARNATTYPQSSVPVTYWDVVAGH